jgi:signal transduction histidine kinase
MEYGGGVGECPHAGVEPLYPVPHLSRKRYISKIKVPIDYRPGRTSYCHKENMEYKICYPVPKLRCLGTPISQTAVNVSSAHQDRDLEYFIQLQIDQLAFHPQIQWAAAVYQDPQIPRQRQAIEGSHPALTPSEKTLTYLQSERWLTCLPEVLELESICSELIEPGFYYMPFGNQNQPMQYLLIFTPEPLSLSCRRFINRTAMGVRSYLDLRQQNWQHRQRIQALEEIVQRIGHQLRHPLALISLYSKNLKRFLSPGKLREQVSVICKTTDGLNQSLTEIMQCASSRQLQLSTQDLRILVLKTLDEFQGWIKEKDLRIQFCKRPLKLNLDPLQIKEVLGNLLSNAIYFSPPGTTIFIDWKALQGNVMLTFRDEGPGLSSEDLQKLFEPFYTRRKDGTGLGLAIAHKIVLDHGGQLSAQNSPDKGAEFSMTLPRFMASTHHNEENPAC